MANMHNEPERGRGGTIAREFFFGFLAIALGTYNLLSQFGYVSWNVEVPQVLGNVLLVIVGFVLWLTAFKLWRYRWHTSRLF